MCFSIDVFVILPSATNIIADLHAFSVDISETRA